MSKDWRDDDVLLEELRSVVMPPPVPQRVLEAAYAAFGWRTIDAELASLTFDSATEDSLLAGTRAHHAQLRVMTFTSSTLTIEIEVTEDALLGQIVPPNAGLVAVLDRSGETDMVQADTLGCFTVTPIPTQPFRLRVEGLTPTSTGWITL
ncbi:MAG: hypothetical protein WCG47_02115 [Dermatophilaceae bacterium]